MVSCLIEKMFMKKGERKKGKKGKKGGGKGYVYIHTHIYIYTYTHTHTHTYLLKKIAIHLNSLTHVLKHFWTKYFALNLSVALYLNKNIL